MATAHLIRDGKEITARTLVLKRHVNIESVESWWRAARRALTGKDVPLSFQSVDVERDYIRFKCSDGTIVMIDRKRAML